MTASPTPIPARLFSETLCLAQGVMIWERNSRGGWWTAGVSLLRENNQSSVANSQSNYRDYTATAQTHILGKIGWRYTKYNFLLEWMVVEKHVLLCHSIIW